MFRKLLGVLLLCACAAAQARDPEKGKKILEQTVQALGGQAYLNVRDTRAQGKAFVFSRYEELEGMVPITNFERWPDKYRQEQGKKRDVIFVLNGEHAWESTFRGVREYPEPELEAIRMRRMLSVDYILRFRLGKEPGLEVAAMGTDMVDGRQVDIVEINDAENRTVTLFIDRHTHLPVRREWVIPNPKFQNRDEYVEMLGKYSPAKGAPGVMVPLYIHRETNGIKTFEAFFDEVHTGAKLSDSLFERPAGKELLVPGRKK
jgi:hypothetical protein